MSESQKNQLINMLRERSTSVRMGIFETAMKAGEGHVASALSIVEIVTTLYFHVLNIDPKHPWKEDRDRFILSKGHACLALYQALAQTGFFPKKELNSFLQMNTKLAGHPMMGLPGIEMSTGSLGHGLSIGVGAALAGRMDHLRYRTFVLIGDGESNEGMIWEAAMAASHYRLDKLVAIVDRNNYQCDGSSKEIMNIASAIDKWKSFGWAAAEVDGHDVEELVDVLEQIPLEKERPTAIIAHTTKGKGVPFMESSAEWHYRSPTREELTPLFAHISTD